MESKRRKSHKVELHPVFMWLRGKIGTIVYRRTRNGETSAYASPDMSHIEWSPAQKVHRLFYPNMAKKSKRSKGRPFDRAVKNYHNDNDMLWIKIYGDLEKPIDWRW